MRHRLGSVVLLRKRRLREDAAAVLDVPSVGIVRRLQLRVRDREREVEEERLALVPVQEGERLLRDRVLAVAPLTTAGPAPGLRGSSRTWLGSGTFSALRCRYSG